MKFQRVSCQLRVLRSRDLSLLLRPATWFLLLSGSALTWVIFLFGLSHGSQMIPFSTLLSDAPLDRNQHYIIWQLRYPRLMMALLAGAMLGASGAVMQSVTRNGLADPSLLGIKEGTLLVVLTQLLFFPQFSLLWRPVSGIIGGLLVALIVVVMARDLSRTRFILIGVGVSWGLSALIGCYLSTADSQQVQMILAWMAGSLNGISLDHLILAAAVGLPVSALLLYTARAADILLLGNATATGLGISPAPLILIRFIAPVILTATVVSCVGSLGFVGLIAPHLARHLNRGGQMSLLICSALLGAILVLLADNIGRLAFAPLQLPAGIVISLVGGPFFLWLLWQRRHQL